MEILLYLWDLLVHLDKHLASLLAQYGVWVYLILFLIVFCETGLVVTPFLPGDSLLFIAGALTATGSGAGQLDLAHAERPADRRGDPRQHHELLDRPLFRAQGIRLGGFALFQPPRV